MLQLKTQDAPPSAEMTMHRVLIDAYNVMMHPEAEDLGWHTRDKERDHRLFLEYLARWQALRDIPVTVVFDGLYVEGRKLEAAFPRLMVKFSGGHRIADAVVVELTARDSRPGDLTVVSSDRQVRRRVRSHGAVSMPSDEFLARMQADRDRAAEAESRREPWQKQQGGLRPGEVEHWRERFGFSSDEEIEL